MPDKKKKFSSSTIARKEDRKDREGLRAGLKRSLKKEGNSGGGRDYPSVSLQFKKKRGLSAHLPARERLQG